MERPKCKCGNLCKPHGKKRVDGSQGYYEQCRSCLRKKYKEGTGQWRAFKKDECELCGFIPVHPCQLDVDHIDGDKSNNDPSNFQTLCANCHRLKTYKAKDHIG